jgi:CBS domain-containing protein
MLPVLSPEEVSALDPVAYVRRVPPFDLLPEPLFLEAAAGLEIALFPKGTRLASAGGRPLEHLYVIRRGAVRLEEGGLVLQVLEEAEVFGYTSLISGKASLDVVVEEDLLAYCLPAAEFEKLLGDARFAAHFAVGLTDRLKASLERVRSVRFEPDVGVPVGSLVRRGPIWLPADATVRDAARAMRDESISSVLLRCEPPGIVTDRDLRNRVLGEDLGPEIPAARVCSRPLRTVAAATPLYEAWRTLLDSGVNHMPVVRDGEIVGVVTSTDLLRHSAQGPVAVLRRVERLASRDALPGYGAKVTEMASALLAAGLDATVIAGFVAQLGATLLRRVLHLAERDVGAAPVPYAWIVFGPEARREQILLGSQENALVYADEGAGSAPWFQTLASQVNRDLEAAGFPPSTPDRMARGTCGTLSWWTRRVEEALDARPHEAPRYLDLRRAAGTLDLSPVEEVLARAPRRRLFVRTLAKQALSLEPPMTLLLRLRGSSSRVDLERQGLRPIVALARCFAVEAASTARGTLDRLDQALRAGVLSEATHAGLTEAFRFLLRLRLSVQLRAVAAGASPVDEVALSELTGMERTRLKESFRAIRKCQENAAYRYQPDLVMDRSPPT